MAYPGRVGGVGESVDSAGAQHDSVDERTNSRERRGDCAVSPVGPCCVRIRAAAMVVAAAMEAIIILVMRVIAEECKRRMLLPGGVQSLFKLVKSIKHLANLGFVPERI